MDEQEQILFDRFEKDTNHQFLMKLTEITAKLSGLLIIVALILFAANISRFGYPVFKGALAFLFITLLFAIAEERVRLRIQNRVNRELEQ